MTAEAATLTPPRALPGERAALLTAAAREAGLAMTPGAVIAAIVGPVVARRGPRPVVIGGAVALGAAGLAALWLVLEEETA